MPPTPRILAPAFGVAALAAIAALLGGCTKPVAGAGNRRTPAPTVLAASTTPTRPAPPVPPRTVPATPTFGETSAVPCGGYPTSDQVVALLRRTPVLPANVTVTVQTGPLCSGTWQYTVLTVLHQDPLQVVTRGAPSALLLVTAGTDVCSDVAVRASAPAGIRTVARC